MSNFRLIDRDTGFLMPPSKPVSKGVVGQV